MSNAFTLTIANGIARVVIDLPGEKVNKFSAAVMTGLSDVLNRLEHENDLKVVVFTSGKPGMFIAGADIKDLEAIATEAEALDKAHAGQRLFQRVTDLKATTIAVIDGPCLGGGMEFALACDWRIASDEDKTILGLPEVSLGIIPGWGGTQRLPRLIGIRASLDLILGAKTVPARKALKLGMVDRLVPRAFLADEVDRLALALKDGSAPTPQRVGGGWLMEGNPLGRLALFRGARSLLLKKTRGLMPAPMVALEVIRDTCGMPLDRGLEVEAERFATLAPTPTCKHLIACFFANEATKKDAIEAKPRVVNRAGVLGAGVMGGGIAWACAHKGIAVRMKDLGWDAIAKGLHTADDYNRQLTKLRKLTPGQANVDLHRITGTVDWSGFAGVDVVIEAVVEDLKIKQKVLADLEGHVRDDVVIATNTSSLSVAAMAGALKRPERFAGMHFFNPVNRMPLVEVVSGPATSPETIATVSALARKLGKTPVVVKDCPGFLVNRILLPYLNEAARCLEDGCGMETIDRVIFDFGMPMGPFTLSDEVGLDVGYKVARILAEGYGERMQVAEVLKVVYEDMHLLGTKGGKGFFMHGKSHGPNPELVAGIAQWRERGGKPTKPCSDADIRDRCLLIMVNEAARCVEESVIDRPALLDLAMVMGTGFPPQRGGLLHYANELGTKVVADRLSALSDRFGSRFTPCQLITDLARQGKPLPV